MAFSKSLRTSSSGFRTLGAGFFSCGGEVIVGNFFGGEEGDDEVCFVTPFSAWGGGGGGGGGAGARLA